MSYERYHLAVSCAKCGGHVRVENGTLRILTSCACEPLRVAWVKPRAPLSKDPYCRGEL